MISSVRFLYPESFFPFTFLKNGRAMGLVIERLVRALDSTGVRPDFLPCTHEELIPGLKEGRGDIAACLAITEERREYLLFSRVLLQTGGALFCPKKNEQATSPGELSGGTVATPSSGPLVEVIKKKWPEVRILPALDYSDALKAAAAGSADAAALNLHAGWEAAETLYPGCFHQPAGVFVSLALAAAGLPGLGEPFIERIHKGMKIYET